MDYFCKCLCTERERANLVIVSIRQFRVCVYVEVAQCINSVTLLLLPHRKVGQCHILGPGDVGRMVTVVRVG